MAKSGKSAVNTPFQDRLGSTVPSTKGGNPGTYDHHRTPILSKPHSKGPDTIPLKFYEATRLGLRSRDSRLCSPARSRLST